MGCTYRQVVYVSCCARRWYGFNELLLMTVETLIVKLGVNPKEISKAEIILLTSLVERYNHGYMRRSIYFSYEEVLIKEAEGIIHGYLPEIDGIIYED